VVVVVVAVVPRGPRLRLRPSGLEVDLGLGLLRSLLRRLGFPSPLGWEVGLGVGFGMVGGCTLAGGVMGRGCGRRRGMLGAGVGRG
jgi:hypothetical protein